MKLQRSGMALILAIALATLSACIGESQAAPQPGSQATIVKGGDDRTGEYEAAENWWKPAPDHMREWGWGEGLGRGGGQPGPDHRGRVG